MTKGLAAGNLNSGLAFWSATALPAAPALGDVLVGFFGYSVSLVMFAAALRHLGAARSGAYFSIAPFIGAVLTLGIFRDPITTRFAAAPVLMAGGVWLHLTERHEHQHAHEEMVHEHTHVHDEHHHHAHGPDDPPGEPHVHVHRHEPLVHIHPHCPDLHYRHTHAA